MKSERYKHYETPMRPIGGNGSCWWTFIETLQPTWCNKYSDNVWSSGNHPDIKQCTTTASSAM